jgi:hypothetical protein
METATCFSDAENVIVIDLLRKSSEAEAVALADHVEAIGKKLATIFISHEPLGREGAGRRQPHYSSWRLSVSRRLGGRE